MRGPVGRQQSGLSLTCRGNSIERPRSRPGQNAVVTISVVVPTYRRPEAIRRCVAALQQQDAEDLEILIVDDGSPEPVDALPDGPHAVRILRQANAGPAAARNRGVGAARGDLVCLTDDDCRPAPGWARAFAEAARAGPGLMAGRTVNALAGNVYSSASQDMADYVARTGPGAEFAQSNNLAIGRADYLRAGGFPTDFVRAAGEDRAFSQACAALWPGIRTVADAVVQHDHALDLRSFWRQHRNYGHGAHTWHGMARRRNVATFSRPSFYLGLLAEPLRGGVSPSRLSRVALIALAQVATAQGYAQAARTVSRSQEPSP